MTPRPLQSSVHRMLVLRIGMAALVISTVFASIAYFENRNELQATVAELAALEVGRLNHQVMDLLDRPAGLDSALLQEAFEDFASASSSMGIDDGHFVLARMFDASGRELAQITDDSHANLAAVNDRVNTASFVPLAAGEYLAVTADVNDRLYVGAAVPMTNSSGTVVAQVLGAFAVSENALKRLRADMLLTVAYVVAIVLLTAACLYPIIAGLLGRMSYLTVSLLDANLETMQVLGGAIAKRDADTDAHNYRVTIYSVALAEAIDLPRRQIQSLIKGALLHDVGKLGIPDNVLLKPGKLDDDEFAVMKTHVGHGIDITSRAGWLDDAQDVVGGHHEKFDGAGYPRGVAGEEIPINARIFAIADVFDALTSRRPYKEPMSFETTMEILTKGRGSHFDPELIDAFAEIAADLYREYGGQNDDRAQRRLESLNHEYFRRDIAELMGD